MLCASQNEIMFRPPSVRFIFAHGLTQGLRRRISRKGAEAVGDIVTFGDSDDGEIQMRVSLNMNMTVTTTMMMLH